VATLAAHITPSSKAAMEKDQRRAHVFIINRRSPRWAAQLRLSGHTTMLTNRPGT
jgi:hypothetical protein